MASGRVLLRVERAARLVHVDARAGDVLRALAQPLRDLRRRCRRARPRGSSGSITMPVFTVGLAVEAAGARDTRGALPRLTSSMRDLLDLAQLPVECTRCSRLPAR